MKINRKINKKFRGIAATHNRLVLPGSFGTIITLKLFSVSMVNRLARWHIKFTSISKLTGQIELSLYPILGDPGADSGGEGKSKRAGKYGTKKSKERREEPLETMSYQTSSKRSPPFWLLIGQKNTKVFWHQSEARMAATVWNWSGKTLSPGALLAILYFSSLCQILPLV